MKFMPSLLIMVNAIESNSTQRRLLAGWLVSQAMSFCKWATIA